MESSQERLDRYAFNVADTFEIAGRGLVVVSDRQPPWLVLREGDQIECRSDGKAILRTSVASLVLLHTPPPVSPLTFMLPADVTKSQVPVGCEVFVGESSVRPSWEKPE